MNARDQGAASILQSFHDVDFPERFAAVQHLAEQAAGESLQFGLPARWIEAYPEDVPLDVEIGSRLPGGITQVERRRHGHLPVAWNEIQFRLDIGDEFAERDRAIEQGDAGDVQGDLFAFQVKESRIDSRQTAAEDRRLLVHRWSAPGFAPAALTDNWRGRPRCRARPPNRRTRHA